MEKQSDQTERPDKEPLTDNHLAYLLRRLPFEVVIRDSESRIKYANDAFGNSYDCETEELVGRLDCELWIEHGRTSKEVEKWLAEDREVLQTGQKKEYIEWIKREDGEIVYFHNIKQRIMFPDGNLYLLAVYYDITDQDILEENLHRIQLKAAEREGVQKTAVTYAHKINSPLSGILGLAQLISERPETSEESKAMLVEIIQAANDISTVVDKMLSITDPRTIGYTGDTKRIDENSV